MKYIFAVVFLAGCASPIQLSAEGARVRPVSDGIAARCTHLGMVRSFQPVIVGGLSAAQVDIRNKVAAQGGNALVISAQTSDARGHGEVIGDAYSCS